MKDEFKIHNTEYYSLMFLPPSGKGMKTIRISKSWVWRLLVLGVGLLITVAIITAFSVNRSLKLSNYKQLKRDVVLQHTQLEKFGDSVQQIEKKLFKLMKREQSMEDILGSKNRKKKRARKRKSRAHLKKLKRELNRIAKTKTPLDEKLQMKLEIIETQLAISEKNLKSLNRKLESNREKFASTPSIIPVFGRIRSNYGWRIHPKTGKRQFHKGVDIPSWLGAPVKSTAEGVVEFSGWAGGYGWLIIVGHKYGYRTFYAHLSELLVSSGQPVKKGEIIGKIGESGFTTGPHIHYEIRRWRRSIPPKKHLDLDLFTASTKLW